MDKSFSPSLLHQRLMSEISPRMEYKGQEFQSWKLELRDSVRSLIGFPEVDRPPLNVKEVWKRESEFGIIQKIVFTSEIDAEVPAYVCLPYEQKQKMPFCICVQGHSTGMHNSIAVAIDDESKTIDVDGDRDFAVSCLKNGMAAICIEQRSLGTRQETVQEFRHPDTCYDSSMHALALGRTMIGERVYDVDRALDYLETRDDVHWDRVGVMGNSGGGTTTLFAAAVLDRVKFAMPSCYFCTFKDSIMSIHHCCCNFVPGILQLAEMADILGTFAPKPVVVVAGEQDHLFPIEAVRGAFAGLKGIYTAAGAGDQCRLFVGSEGHRFYAGAWDVMLPMINR